MFAVMKLLEQVVVVARRRRLAQNTIDVYRLWIRQFLTFSARRLGQWKPPEKEGELLWISPQGQSAMAVRSPLDGVWGGQTEIASVGW
jgi:hypothetical protein